MLTGLNERIRAVVECLSRVAHKVGDIELVLQVWIVVALSDMTCSAQPCCQSSWKIHFSKMTMLSSFRAYFASPIPIIVLPYPLRATQVGPTKHGDYTHCQMRS